MFKLSKKIALRQEESGKSCESIKVKQKEKILRTFELICLTDKKLRFLSDTDLLFRKLTREK